MRQGCADQTDWVTLRDAAAMAETMASGGVGPEALPDASAALAVLHKAHNSTEALPASEVKTVSEVLVWVKKTVERFNVSA